MNQPPAMNLPAPDLDPQITPLLEQQIAMLLDLTRIVAEVDDLHAVFQGLLQPMAEATGWCYGEVWLPDEQQGLLRSAHNWHRGDAALATFAASSAALRFTSGVGVLGRVWQSRRAEWIEDIAAIDPARALSPERVLAAGLRSVFILPIMAQDSVLALLSFFAREVRPPNLPLIRLISLAAAQIGAAIQRHQAQEVIRAREALLRSVTDSALDAIVAADHAGQIITWNPAAERMFGYSAAEAIGRPLDTFIPAIGKLGCCYAAEHLHPAPEPQIVGRIHQQSALRRDGSEFPAEISLAAWASTEGDCFTAVIRDITQRKQAEEALRQTNESLERRVAERTAALSEANSELERAARMKDEFLANMSHELRTPLNAVLTLTESIAEGIYGPITARQAHALAAVSESGGHLLALINDILDLAKIESGKLELYAEPTDVEAICVASLRMVQQLAHTKRLCISHSFDTTVEFVEADPRRLKQILVNLLSNAVKFTPEGGSVRLGVYGDRDAGVIRFTVEDTGIGIPHEALPQLFRPFVQLDSSLNRRYQGSGLGLALIARLAELHGGGVSVSSAPGQGSSFTVALPWRPQVPPDTPADACPPAQRGPGAHERPALLIAEDNAQVLQTLSDYLEAYGYHVHVARNGVEAVSVALEARPAVILMDIQMPVLDGLEAIRQIRTSPGVAGVPIIALTALAMASDRERCLAAGADDYLSKPVSLAALLDRIEQLRRRRSSVA